MPIPPYNAQPLRFSKTSTGTLWSSADLAPFRRFVRLGTTGADTELREIVQLAGPWVESKCATTLQEETITLEVDLPQLGRVKNVDGDVQIELPFGPVSSVTSIAWDGGSETSTTVDLKSLPQRVQLPDDGPRDANTVTVTYVAGHSPWSDLSAAEQFAVMLATSHLWQNREAVSAPGMISVPFMLQYALSAIDRSTIG